MKNDKEYHKRYYAINRKRIRAVQKKYREENPLIWRKQALKKYGLTPDMYRQVLEAQSGVCDICKGPPNGKDDQYHVDHDHVTGRVRGLLCTRCNQGLGMFKDDVSSLARAVEYLNLSRKKVSIGR